MSTLAVTVSDNRSPSVVEDDDALVGAVARGDADALAAIYREHSHGVFEMARTLVGQRTIAEEVVQDVFLRFWNNPERFDRQRGTLRTYLITLAYGRSIDIARSETSRRRREEREARLAGPPNAPSEGLDGATSAIEIRTALEGLREPEREAIALAYFLGYSYREVASRLGVPEGTIKNRIRAGLSRLRDELTPTEAVALT
jgi:RNA polymerase sigma-70 factor (ECF subfamily)